MGTITGCIYLNQLSGPICSSRALPPSLLPHQQLQEIKEQNFGRTGEKKKPTLVTVTKGKFV